MRRRSHPASLLLTTINARPHEAAKAELKSLVIAPDLERLGPHGPKACCASAGTRLFNSALAASCSQMSRAGPLASKSVRGVIGHQLNLTKMQL